MTLWEKVNGLDGLQILQERVAHLESAALHAEEDVAEHASKLEEIDVRGIFDELRQITQEGKLKEALIEFAKAEVMENPDSSGVESLWRTLTTFGLMSNGPSDEAEIMEYFAILMQLLVTHNSVTGR